MRSANAFRSRKPMDHGWMHSEAPMVCVSYGTNSIMSDLRPSMKRLGV